MINGKLAFIYTLSQTQSMGAHRHILETLQSIFFYRSLPRQYPELDLLISLLLERLEWSEEGGGIDGTDDKARVLWETEVCKLVGKIDGWLDQLDGLGVASFQPVGKGAWWLVGEP
ncbi:MAG: hypothetical protein Q9184_005352 [Pyrenodesmia sp. 2 TL-2023]